MEVLMKKSLQPVEVFLNSANVLRNMDESELYDVSYHVFQGSKMGTVPLEIKSGYGLDFDSEVKMLHVIRLSLEKRIR
ncbi:MAG: hypothetical protein IPN55_15260 [Saprospiraceae bacterium]|nr:hypothetical protein [Candidatus Brachybacter algidus]